MITRRLRRLTEQFKKIKNKLFKKYPGNGIEDGPTKKELDEFLWALLDLKEHQEKLNPDVNRRRDIESLRKLKHAKSKRSQLRKV